jgi:gamma-glutamyltranspeptidase / glutathione hydrolase
MAIDRRTFIRQAGVGLAASGLAAAAQAKASSTAFVPCDQLVRQGPKEVVHGKSAVASSQNPIVTQTMLDVLKVGGNAADAVVAGSITQAVVQLEHTNHTGSVSFLYWEAKTGKTYYLNSQGTLVPDLPPFRTYPQGPPPIGRESPMACIPGFMPGMAAIHARFGSKPWKSLVEPAIPWAEDGFPVDEFQRATFEWDLDNITYFPAQRALYTPNGFSPSVGEKLKIPALAKTLRRLADEGPEYFTHGDWARHFVALGNDLGWKIKLEDLSSNPPRWVEPVLYRHKGYEIAQATPPQRQGVFCALVLGMLRHLEVSSLGHYTESADSLYYMGQALRRADFECGLLNDSMFFEVPLEVWMLDEYHASLATILKRSRPKAGVDLTEHVLLSSDPALRLAFGWGPTNSGDKPRPSGQQYNTPPGSCELTCVDAQGNWVQMMNTLQSGGIPGMVVDGVPMRGSHATLCSMHSSLSGWLGLPGSRMRSSMSHTIILKGGRPVHSLGSPGSIYCTVPQMISNVLDYNYDPYAAAVLPRMWPMRDDFIIEIETRIPERVVRDLAKIGGKLSPLPPYDLNMGSYQQAWRDPVTGLLSAGTDPRRGGKAGGI